MLVNLSYSDGMTLLCTVVLSAKCALTATQSSWLLQLLKQCLWLQVQDLQNHYQYAATSTKKLNFLGPDHEQLPYPLWDPEIWSNPRQL